MSDAIADGQRIARALGHPEVQYVRPIGSDTQPVPLYYVRWNCTLDELFVVTVVTVPADAGAHLKFFYVRSGVPVTLYDAVIAGFTANVKTSLASPATALVEGDIIYAQITPAPAVALPCIILGAQLSLT